jgi:hypothetical protein
LHVSQLAQAGEGHQVTITTAEVLHKPDTTFLAELAQAAFCDLLVPVRRTSGVGTIRQLGNVECGVHMLEITLQIADLLTTADWAAIIARVERQPHHVFTDREANAITFGVRGDDSDDPLTILREQANLVGLTLYAADVLPVELIALATI